MLLLLLLLLPPLPPVASLAIVVATSAIVCISFALDTEVSPLSSVRTSAASLERAASSCACDEGVSGM